MYGFAYAAVAAHHFTVVRGEDYDGIFFQALCFQTVQDASKVFIDAGYHGEVVFRVFAGAVAACICGDVGAR